MASNDGSSIANNSEDNSASDIETRLWPESDNDNDETESSSTTKVKYGGYEYEFVQSMDGTLEDMFMCKICHLPSRNAQLSVCCGHTFCKTCLDRMKHSSVSSSKTCPVCRDDKDFGTVANKQVDRKIRGLRIFCTNKEKGCQWQGELNDINAHLNKTNGDGCMYESVQCNYGCGKTLQRQYLTRHVTTECSHRKVNCQYCNLSGMHAFIEGSHKAECPKVVIPCPNHCGANNILREDMDEHRNTCPFEVVSCKYMKLGCGTRMAHQEVEKHGKEKVEEHLCLATERIEKLENIVSQLVWSSHLTSKAASSSKVAPVMFRIKGFTDKRYKGVHWKSPYFYTEREGYEMYMTVNFGDSYLKVYTSLGRNEDDLNWPFRGRFDITILNQICDSEHFSKRLLYDDRCLDEIAGRDATYAWGLPRYISYDHLCMESPTCQYVKDDSMYIRVSYFGLEELVN